MDWRPAAVALLLAPLLVAFAPGAAAQGSDPLLSDPAGDVQVLVGGAQPVPDPGNVYSCADLHSLGIVEARTDLTFTLAVADLKDPGQDPAADGCRYQVFFTHNGRQFQLTLFRTLPAVAAQPFAALAFRDTAEGAWSSLWSTTEDARWDLSADTFMATVPRDLLADADGAAPFPGRTLERIHVLATSGFGGASISLGLPGATAPWPAYAVDSMPDDAAQAASFAIQVGVQQSGHARLSSETPFRASNGEATTFVYNVTARNIGSREDTFELKATGVPAGYTLVLPVPVVKVEGGRNVTVPVLLTMPFGHQHGAVSSFVLEMRSLSDAGSVGRLEMGVRFLAVPQPAGHHDTVYLHANAPAGGLPVLGFTQGYFNTLEQDPEDAGANLYASGFSGSGATWTSRWYLLLQPALEMGLDVDPAKVGTVRIPIGSTLPLLEAQMSATLRVAQDSPFGFFPGMVVKELARAGPTAPIDIDPAGQAVFEADLTAVEGGHRVPYEKGANLWLEVIVTYQATPTLGFAGEGVYIAPGGSARLPLREWHDSVDQALSIEGGPDLSALSPQERLVNPGKAAVFPVSVANPLDDDVTIHFEVTGSNLAWASLPQDRIRVPAHGTAQVTVVVRAPAGAVDQERADLVLQAYASDRPEARGLLRLVTIVDTDADHPDDTAVADDLAKKESPGPGLAISLGAVALWALALRRWR